MKIVVIGGGYAGLACLMELRRRMPDAQLHLYDPRASHLKLTHLHETVRQPLGRYEVGFGELSARLRFTHHHARVEIGKESLTVDGAALDYDFAALATGARPATSQIATNVYDRDALATKAACELVRELRSDPSRAQTITVVGGGASGVQFLFELAALRPGSGPRPALRLIDGAPRPLMDQPEPIARYVVEKLEAAGVEYLPETRWVGAHDGRLQVEGGGGERELESGLTLALTGLEPAPRCFETDAYGAVAGLRDVYAAGDCARYRSRGDDAMTAQIAVRQGKHIARNIDRAARGVEPLEYFFRELGYVVSLGQADAAGWMLVREKVVTGIGAFAIKELVEAQYDLFVAGVDTYLV